MRVLLVTEAAAAGVGRHVIDLAAGLLSRGARVDLVYSDRRMDDVFIGDVRALDGRSGFLALRTRIDHAARFSDLAASLVLRDRLKTHGPFDVVHSHSTKAGLIGRLGLWGNRVKRIYSPHGFLSMDPNRSAVTRGCGRILEFALSRMCDAVVAVSTEEKNYAVNNGIPAEKICSIPHGVSPAPSDGVPGRRILRRAWGVNDDEVCIGLVGRMVPFKAHSVAIRAFAKAGGVKARLAVVGDGPMRSTTHHLAESLGVGGRVIWLGEQDAKMVMHAFDVLVHPSDFEAGPIVVLEAMARGMPIVGTAVGGIPEYVRQGVNGFVAPRRGVDEIAAALEALINDPELRVRMGKASVEVSRNFSLDRMVERTAALYEQVVSGTWRGETPDSAMLPNHRGLSKRVSG